MDKLRSKFGKVDLNDAEDDEQDKKLERTYTIWIHNKTQPPAPLTVAAWAVRASKKSEYTLTTFRAPPAHCEMASVGSVLLADSESGLYKVASMRAPKKLDFRDRWGWFFVNLKAPSHEVYLQAYIRVDRGGVEEALIGRTDLDSSTDEPMSSGELGKGEIDNEKRTVTFTIDESFLEVKNTVDDKTKKASKILLGKGVSTTSYVSQEHGKISFIVDDEARYHEFKPLHGHLAEMRESLHEIEGLSSRYVAAFVELGEEKLFEGFVKVNPVTGVMTGQGFPGTSHTTSILKNNSVLSYGFHDAGASRQDQLYAYLTPDQRSWLGKLIASDQRWLEQRFSILALAASHDCGMFGELHAGLNALIQKGDFGHFIQSYVDRELATPVIRGLVALLSGIRLRPDRVIENMAMTQRDNFKTQLEIGVRFFDMRPGYCFHDVIHTQKERLYHQHAMVPGCGYIEFLVDIFEFLGENPSEIVVVELKDDGMVVKEDRYDSHDVLTVYSMVPTIAELEAEMAQAREKVRNEVGKRVQIGGAKDLDRRIGELINEGTRLIMLDRMHHPQGWERGDSYDHIGYNTMSPAPIIACLEKTWEAETALAKSSPPAAEGIPSRGCIYQLQCTPTADIGEDVRASLTYSDASSLLTFVKPLGDRATYPWIKKKMQEGGFTEKGNVVFLNDFVEGVLVEHALEVSRQRAGL